MQNILDFEKDYPDAAVYFVRTKLSLNENILNAANQVIENNRNRKPKNLWTENEKETKSLTIVQIMNETKHVLS